MIDYRKPSRVTFAFYFLLITSSAMASETITYSYDAMGRLVKVVRSGSVNNGVTTTYDQDKADNRKKVITTGSWR